MRILLISLLNFSLSLSFNETSFAATSVYEVEPVRDLAISGAAATVSLLTYAFASDLIKPKAFNDPNEVNGFDRNAIGNKSTASLALSDALLGAALVGPVLYDLYDQGSATPEFWEDMIVYTQTLAAAGALVSVTKVLVQRPLPRTYEGQAGLVDTYEGYRSFYSGHTTMTAAALAAFAVTSQLRYDTGAWPWVITGVVSTSVGIARVLGGVHFPTDVITGGAVGLGVGTLIPLLHSRKNNTAAMVVPITGGAKIVLTKVF